MNKYLAAAWQNQQNEQKSRESGRAFQSLIVWGKKLPLKLLAPFLTEIELFFSPNSPVCPFRHALFEPRHDKTNKVSVRPAKTQISLGYALLSRRLWYYHTATTFISRIPTSPQVGVCAHVRLATCVISRIMAWPGIPKTFTIKY